MARRVSKNGPHSITPLLAARIKELVQLGWSSARICEDLGGAVSRQAIDYHRKTRLRSVRAPGEVAPASVPVQLEERVRRAVAAQETVDGVEEVQSLLEDTKELLELIRPSVRDGAIRTSEWATLVKLATELAERVEAMKPKPPPDPALDPANVEAKRKFLAIADRYLEAGREKRRKVEENR